MPPEDKKSIPFGDSISSEQSKKIGLKKVSSQKSIFDSMSKKPSQDDFNKQVNQLQDHTNSLKGRVTQLAIEYNRAMSDKTLPKNKNVFQVNMELDLLRGMVKVAQEINDEPNEGEGEGSLNWITLLLKTCLNQRDSINNLEYELVQIKNELAKLDSSKNNE